MYKYSPFLYLGMALAFCVLLWGPSYRVLATVGGPTYVSRIAYAPQGGEVYYLVSDMGGRGCPAIIHKVDLGENQDFELKTCDEVFQQFFQGNENESQQKYGQYISDTFQDLSYLGSVSLKENNIDISVRALSEYREAGELLWTNFQATVIQDQKQLAQIDFRGCSKDQPHTFEGYYVPNTRTMILLISNKWDCFEGGYVRESLALIQGVLYYQTGTIRSFKQELPTEPNIGNAVLYASQHDIEEPPVATASYQSFVAMFAVGIFGILVGYSIRYFFSGRNPMVIEKTKPVS